MTCGFFRDLAFIHGGSAVTAFMLYDDPKHAFVFFGIMVVCAVVSGLRGEPQ